VLGEIWEERPRLPEPVDPARVSETTKAWWSKLVSATIQLIILKPVIALVFAVGLSLTGKSTDTETLLEGMLVLVLAVFAWPAVARFFTFASVTVVGGSGLGALLGFAAGRATAGSGAGAPRVSSRTSSLGGWSTARWPGWIPEAISRAAPTAA